MYKKHKRQEGITLYVGGLIDGDDKNDGLSGFHPLATVSKALELLAARGPLDGRVKFKDVIISLGYDDHNKKCSNCIQIEGRTF